MQYPASWEAEVIEDIPAFYDPEGAGALQLVATRSTDDSCDLQAEMARYLERHGIEFQPDRIVGYKTESGLDAMVCEFLKEDRFWLVQMLTLDEKLLVVIYNADELPEPELIGILAAIIRSIKFDGQVGSGL